MVKSGRAKERPGAARRVWQFLFGRSANRKREAGAAPNKAVNPHDASSEITASQALSLASRWCSANASEVSIILVTRESDASERDAVSHIWQSTENAAYEVLIVHDRPSADERPTRKFGRGVGVIELGTKRYRGEARNIAAERAKGKYLCFVAEGLRVRRGWLAALLNAATRDPHIAAVVTQSIDWPAVAADDGAAMTAPTTDIYAPFQALLVERQVFFEVGGFDLAYEPPAYEDWDLCVRLIAAGRRIGSVSGDRLFWPRANIRLPTSPGRTELINHAKFVARSVTALHPVAGKGGSGIDDKPAVSTAGKQDVAAHPREVRQRAAVFTPYDLTPGGGERYILTLAYALRRSYDVELVTKHPYSRLRLDQLAREFDLDLAGVRLIDEAAFHSEHAPHLLFALGNNIVPRIPARGPQNWFICQFPFPMKEEALQGARERLAAYAGVIVYSEYARGYVRQALRPLGLDGMPVEVVAPPVTGGGGDAARKRPMILNVGRFFVGAHAKGQESMISVFRDIHDKFAEPVELHFAGSSAPTPKHMKYLFELQDLAAGLPIHFHVNPSLARLRALYRDAALYWHGTGMRGGKSGPPGSAEHFGITIVEAMSAECVPLAFDWGGPAEIIANGEDGFLFNSGAELAELTLDLVGEGRARRVGLGRAAAASARRYSVDRFSGRLFSVLAASPGQSGRSGTAG